MRFSSKVVVISQKLVANKGFTLVELLVVISVVGILATVLIATINPGNQIRKSNDVQRKTALKTLQSALEQYYQDNGSYPVPTGNICVSSSTTGCWSLSTATRLLGPFGANYIKSMPLDPTQSGSNCTNMGGTHRVYAYQAPAGGASYILSARLENTRDPQAIDGSVPGCAYHNYSLTNQQ